MGHEVHTVTITINEAPLTLLPGTYAVAELKTRASVPLAFELELMKDDRLSRLGDTEMVTIVGGECFIAHPKTGQSS